MTGDGRSKTGVALAKHVHPLGGEKPPGFRHAQDGRAMLWGDRLPGERLALVRVPQIGFHCFHEFRRPPSLLLARGSALLTMVFLLLLDAMDQSP